MIHGQATTTSDSERAARYLAAVPAPANGSRNDTLNATAYALVERFANLSEGEFIALLSDWNSQCSPPLGDAEFSTTIQSAWRGAQSKGVAGSKARPQSGRARHTTPARPAPPRANQTPPQAPTITYDLTGAQPLPAPIANSTVQLIEALFQPGEGIRIAPAELNEDGKEVPDGGGNCFSREEWLSRLAKRNNDINQIFSSTARTGIYIGVNPYKVGGTKDNDVISYRHALVEFDEGLNEAEQFALYQKSRIPVAAIISSGGKSVHAWVRVDARDRQEYDARVALLYSHFKSAGLTVDEANKNPGRLSRLPGCVRFRRRQELLSLRAGCESWQEWTQHIGATGEAADVEQEVQPFNIWKPSQFLSYVEPEGSNLLLPAYLTRGELTTLIGQPGLGKTRLALWLAICQITGRNWCGLDVHPDPVKWLFIGDENSISRWKMDIERMFSILTREEIALVEEHLRLPALAAPGDGDIWLGDTLTQKRLALTIAQEHPGVVVADPLANLAPEDISKPGPMKEAVRLILSICRKSAPDAAISLLHHARSGRGNIIQGTGWDAGNFASGGKALLGSARCQINLMPGSADDDTKLVLSCAKCNNAPRFATRGLVFDPKSFTYHVDGDFKLDEWQADVEGKRRATSSSLCTVEGVTAAVRDGYNETGALIDHLMLAFKLSDSTAKRHVKQAVQAGGIANLTRGKYILGKRAETYLKNDAI